MTRTPGSSDGDIIIAILFGLVFFVMLPAAVVAWWEQGIENLSQSVGVR